MLQVILRASSRGSIPIITGIVVITALCLLLASPLRNSQINADETRTSYIVQAGSLEQALLAATDVGGNITHELSIINAVGADLSASQVQVLRGMEGVKVLVNGKVSVTSEAQTFVYDDLVTVRDEFLDISYTGSDGDLGWAGPWVEQDDGEVDNGNIRVKRESDCLGESNCLKLELGDGVGRNIYREVDLEGVAGAVLTYFYYHEFEGNDRAVAEISQDGGATYSVLATYSETVNFKQRAFAMFDVSDFIGSQTRIRFRITGDEKHKKAWIDDLQLLVDIGDGYSGNLPPVNHESIRDEFETETYAGNDGTLGWSGAWVESDDGEVNNGNVRIKEENECLAGYCLKFEAKQLGNNVYREADLYGAGSASLVYSYFHELEKDDQIVAEISRDGGSSYDVLKVYEEGVPQAALEVIDVTGYIGTQTRVRFRVTGADDGKKMWIDDVSFLFETYVPDANYAEYVEASTVHSEGTLGSGVTVAVVDTGYWPHPALDYNSNNEGRVLVQYDAILDQIDAVGLPTVDTDDNGHGTYVTSVLLSSETSGPGKKHGVAPMANLVSVKAFGADGSSSYLDVIRGIDFIVQNKAVYDIKVVNLSFGSPAQSLYWQDPLAQAVMAAWHAGIVVVTSAGNTGPEPMTIGVPGNVPYVITVGSISDAFTKSKKDDDYLSSYSGVGPTIDGFVKPDVIAPGGHLLGLMPPNSQLAQQHPEFHDGLDFFIMSGTSQAAAVASGVVALMLDADPTLSADDVKCRLMSTTKPAVNNQNKLAYSVFQQGAGLINANRAIHANVNLGCANGGLDTQAGSRWYPLRRPGPL